MKHLTFSPPSPSRLLASTSTLALCALALLARPGTVTAGPITWGPGITETAATDVATLGNLMYAYACTNTGSTTLNGVTFSPRDQPPNGASGTSNYLVGGNPPEILWSGINENYGSFFSTAAPFANLPTAYQNILRSGDYGGAGTNITYSLQMLTPGRVYIVQWWVNDPRGGADDVRVEMLTSVGGNTTYCQFSSDVSGGPAGVPGQFAIGIFTATATNQIFTARGQNQIGTGYIPQFSCIQVRDVTGFNLWGGYINGNVDFTTSNWAGNNPLATLTNCGFTNLVFADTNNTGGAIANSALSLQAAGVSGISFAFSNNAVAYTMQNASGTVGLAGSAAVTVSGPGSVTFESPNTYTGGTTVSGGSLSLTGTGSIGASGPIVLNGGTFNAGAGSFTLAASQPITFGGGSMTAGPLTLNGASITNTDVIAGTPLIAAGALTYGASANTITFPTTGDMHGFASYPTQFKLITYTSASGSFNFNPVSLPVGYTGFISNNTASNSIDLVLTAGLPVLVPLTWSGVNGSNWDYLVTPNWVDTTNPASPVAYQNFTAVTFDDSATDTSVYMAATTELPTSVTVNLTNKGITISGPGTMGGTMALTKNGTGTFVLDNSNDYTGGTFLNAGVVAFLSNGVSAAGGITFNGGSLRWLDGNIQDLSGIFTPPTLGEAMMIDIPDTNIVTFSSVLSGAGGLTKLGNGTLIANNANTYAGVTTISAGALQLNLALSASSNTIAVGSVLELYLAGTSSLTNTVTGAGVININLNNGLSPNTYLAGPMSGFTGTINCGAGPYSGTAKVGINSTTVSLPSASHINIANGGTLYLSEVTIASQIGVVGYGNSEGYGALRVTTGAVVSGPVTLLGNASVGQYNTEAGTISGPIGDGGRGYNLVNMGSSAGSITLTGTNTYSGATIISNGTLFLSGNGSIANSDEIFINTNTTFDVTGVTGGFNLAPGQILSGIGSAVGPGAVVNGNVNAATGALYLLYSNGTPALTVSGGTLSMNNNAVTVAVLATPLTTGSYQLTQGGNVAGSVATSPLTVSGGGIASAGIVISNNDLYLVVNSLTAPLTWEGNHSGNWDLTTTNWVLTGSPSTPALYVNDSVVTFDDTATGTTSVSLASAISPGGMTVSTTNDSYTFSGAGQLAGGMSLTVNGTGTLTINNSNTFFGGTVLNGGLVAFGPYGLGAGPVTFNGGTLSWLAGNSEDISSQIQPIPGSATANLVVSSPNAVTFASGLSGSGGLVKSGTGFLALGGAGSYGNGTAINAGILQLNSATAAGTGQINDSTTLNINIAGGTLNNQVNGAGIINVIETASTVTSLASLSSFTGTLNCPSGAGTSAKVELFSGFGGPTINIANGGTLWISGQTISPAINISGAGNSEGYGALRVENGSYLAGPMTLLGNTALGTTTTANSTIAGNIVDGGSGYSLTKVGSGALTISGVNTYGGSTYIDAGTLTLGGGSIANSTNIYIYPGATFSTSGSSFALGANQTLTSVDSGTVSCIISGGATLSAGSLVMNYTAGTPSLINTNGQITLGNLPVTIKILGASLPSGTYTLISAAAGSSAGTMSGTAPTSVTLAGFGLAANNSAALQIVNNQLVLNVQSTALPLTWEGNVSAAWDILTTKNWASSGTAEYFANNSPVTFNDTATGATNVSMATSVLPASMVVNTTNKYYTIGGAGQLSGGTSLAKSGPATLTLTTSNSFIGGATINDGGGMLVISNAYALGTGPVTLAKSNSDTGTLQLTTTGNNVIPNAFFGFNTALTNDATVPDIESVAGTNSITNALTITGLGAANTGLSLKSDLPDGLNVTGPVTTTTAGTPSVELNGSGGGAIAGLISDGAGQISLVKDGPGNWTIQTANTFSGGTTINNGTLSLIGITTAFLGSGTVTINSNGALYLNTEHFTFANTITGAGTINMDTIPPFNAVIDSDLSGFTGNFNCPAVPGYEVIIDDAAVNMNSAATVNIPNNATLNLSGVTLSANVNVVGPGNGNGYGALWPDNSIVAGPVTMLGHATFGNSGSAVSTYTAPIGDGGHGYSFIRVGTSTSETIFEAANTYSGSTVVSNGTLSIQQSGSISNSANIALVSGTTFDVSTLTSFPLGANQTLTGLGGGSPPAELNGGNIDMTLGSLAVVESNATPSLDVEGGTLTLNNNPATVIVQGSALGIGSYPLISASSGSVVGTVASSRVTVTGSGLTAGLAGSLQITNNALYLVVQTAPQYQPPTLSGIIHSGSSAVELTFTGPSGQPFTVLTTTNLDTALTNWVQLTNGTFNGSPTNFTDSAATNKARFYLIESP